MYIWKTPDWPQWRFDYTQLAEPLAKVRFQQGRFTGVMESFGFKLREEAVLTTLTLDVLKTSEIEGEHLNADQVRSSIARRLGMDIGALAPVDRYVEGVVEMMLDATRNYHQPLTVERLFAWHGALFPTGRSGLVPIRTATWRDDINGPMQVISGPFGNEKVHYVAPPAGRLKAEVDRFLEWFNTGESGNDAVLKAGLAHLWFVTVHPFDDGNGRIARAIGDMALARSEKSCQRFYSLSAQIQQERSRYYDVLESTQHGTMDVTAWLMWFLECLTRAMDKAEETLSSVICKARFWEQYAKLALNERQIKVLNRLLDDFEGKLTTSKWAKLAKCSQDTAYRDIVILMQHGVLVKNEAGGRGTSYDVVMPVV
jgi:Fic family protein